MIEGYFPGAPDDGPTVADLVDEAERRLSRCRARCELLEAVAEAAAVYAETSRNRTFGSGPQKALVAMRELDAALVAAGATGKAGT